MTRRLTFDVLRISGGGNQAPMDELGRVNVRSRAAHTRLSDHQLPILISVRGPAASLKV